MKERHFLMQDRNLVNVNLTSEMKTSFIDYAMSVIVARALPDVRDGLKPVHRRILTPKRLCKRFYIRFKILKI